METWHVYQLRSDTELLYVGETRQLSKRLRDHKCTKPWWPEVTDVRAEEFTTEDEARQREKEIWAAEKPKYNRISPFATTQETLARRRKEAKAWRQANPERLREYSREYRQQPEVRERHRQQQREYRKRAGKRWQQPGPGLF